MGKKFKFNTHGVLCIYNIVHYYCAYEYYVIRLLIFIQLKWNIDCESWWCRSQNIQKCQNSGKLFTKYAKFFKKQKAKGNSWNCAYTYLNLDTLMQNLNY